MKAFFDPRQLDHAPDVYFRGGAPMPHPEQPERAVLLREMLKDNGFPVLPPADYGTGPITAVHDPDYVAFFADAFARFQAEAPEGALAIPTRHPGRRRGREPRDIHGAMGWWMTDTSTPLTEALYRSAYWSAQSAVAAAEDVMGGALVSYALCRPPGHRSRAGVRSRGAGGVSGVRHGPRRPAGGGECPCNGVCRNGPPDRRDGPSLRANAEAFLTTYRDNTCE